MTRPAVSVVMPFAGTQGAAQSALQALRTLRTEPGDELLLVDNSGALDATRPPPHARVTILPAVGERSPAHARNVGAEIARNGWILFIDADCRPSPGLLDAYFPSEAVPDEVGALAGEVLAAGEGVTVAARYGESRSFLSQAAHLAHPYRPRAVAANLMVRRSAFEHIGGFYEGVRAAEDTDFSWRLQQAGWRIELRPDAWVEHVYRTTIPQLRRQWRGYAAGRAWLARRYRGFVPEPALRRVLSRRRRSAGARQSGSAPTTATPAAPGSRLERARHLMLDALLGVEELAGLTLSNRPARAVPEPPARVVLIAERFPAREDPLVDFARTLKHARVEAVSRPTRLATEIARELTIDYREDDGAAARVTALLKLLVRHPVRALCELRRDRTELLGLAPAAVRLAHDPNARLQPIGGPEAQRRAQQLAALTGRGLSETDRA